MLDAIKFDSWDTQEDTLKQLLTQNEKLLDKKLLIMPASHRNFLEVRSI